MQDTTVSCTLDILYILKTLISKTLRCGKVSSKGTFPQYFWLNTDACQVVTNSMYAQPDNRRMHLQSAAVSSCTAAS